MISVVSSRAAAIAAGLIVAMAVVSIAEAQTIQVKVASTLKEIFDNLPFHVADQAGMFKNEGLDIQLTHFGGGGEVVRAVSTGSMEIGMVAATAGIIAIGKGEPLSIFSAWSAPAFGVLWIVPTDSPIKSIKDLAGKKVGISRPGSASHTGLIAAVTANDIKDKVGIVPVGGPGDSWAAVRGGRVQATWHTAPDVYSLVNRGEARILFDISDYLKEYQQGALVAKADYLDKNAETARKFLRAAAAAVRLIDQNPAVAAKLGAKATGFTEEMMLETIRVMPKGFFAIGAPTVVNLTGSITEAVGTGALKEAPAYDKLVDRRYLP